MDCNIKKIPDCLDYGLQLVVAYFAKSFFILTVCFFSISCTLDVQVEDIASEVSNRLVPSNKKTNFEIRKNGDGKDILFVSINGSDYVNIFSNEDYDNIIPAQTVAKKESSKERGLFWTSINNNSTPEALWSSDGTSEGTVKIVDSSHPEFSNLGAEIVSHKDSIHFYAKSEGQISTNSSVAYIMEDLTHIYSYKDNKIVRAQEAFGYDESQTGIGVFSIALEDYNKFLFYEEEIVGIFQYRPEETVLLKLFYFSGENFVEINMSEIDPSHLMNLDSSQPKVLAMGKISANKFAIQLESQNADVQFFYFQTNITAPVLRYLSTPYNASELQLIDRVPSNEGGAFFIGTPVGGGNKVALWDDVNSLFVETDIYSTGVDGVVFDYGFYQTKQSLFFYNGSMSLVKCNKLGKNCVNIVEIQEDEGNGYSRWIDNSGFLYLTSSVFNKHNKVYINEIGLESGVNKIRSYNRSSELFDEELGINLYLKRTDIDINDVVGVVEFLGKTTLITSYSGNTRYHVLDENKLLKHVYFLECTHSESYLPSDAIRNINENLAIVFGRASIDVNSCHIH